MKRWIKQILAAVLLLTALPVLPVLAKNMATAYLENTEGSNQVNVSLELSEGATEKITSLRFKLLVSVEEGTMEEPSFAFADSLLSMEKSARVTWNQEAADYMIDIVLSGKEDQNIFAGGTKAAIGTLTVPAGEYYAEVGLVMTDDGSETEDAEEDGVVLADQKEQLSDTVSVLQYVGNAGMDVMSVNLKADRQVAIGKKSQAETEPPAPVQPETQPVQPETQPQQTPVQPETQPQQTPVQPETQPQQTPVQPETQPQQTPVQPETQPQQTPVQPETQPQPAPVQPETVPQQTPAQPETVPQQTPVQPETQPQPAPVQPETQPQQTPVQPETVPQQMPAQPETQPQQQTEPAAAQTETQVQTEKKTEAGLAKPVLTVNAVAGSSKLRFSWKKVSGADGYQLFLYDSSSRKYVKFKTVRNGTSYSAEYESGMTYRFKVRAFRKEKDGKTIYSRYSDAAEAQAASFDRKKTAVLRASSEVDDPHITFKWDAVPGAEGYRLYMYNSVKKKYVKLATVRGGNENVLSCTPSREFSYAKVYKFKIRTYAHDENGNTVYGVASNAFRFKTRPERVSGLSVKATGTGKVSLTWDEVPGADGYRIFRSLTKNAGDFERLKLIKGGDAVSYVDRTVESGTKYYYSVRAYTDTRQGNSRIGPRSRIRSVSVK